MPQDCIILILVVALLIAVGLASYYCAMYESIKGVFEADLEFRERRRHG